MSEINLTRQESPDKAVQKTASLSPLKESDFKFDADWFKKVQEAASSELVKSGALPTLALIHFGVDDKPAVPGKPEAPREGGKPADVYQSGDKDRSAKLEYDKDGKPVKFTDYNHDVFERGADGSWSRGKPMFDPPQQVKLNVDTDGKVTIKYPVEDDKTGTKAITRTIQKDGTEVTKYEQASSKDIVTTERKRHADGETLTVKRDGGDQVMQYNKNGDLTSVKTSDGRRYERDDKGSWSEIDKDGNRKSLDGTANDGSKIKGMVRADSNGAVIARDESQHNNSDTYAHRFLPNGVVIHSDRSGASRTTTTPDGLTIKDRSHGPLLVADGGPGTRTFEYRDKDGNVTGQISILRARDGLQKISGNINGEELKLQEYPISKWRGTIAGRSIQHVSTETGNDSIKFTTKDGKNFFIDGTGKIREGDAHQGRKLEERSMVQEMPRDYQKQIEERLKQVDKFKDEVAKDRGWTRKQLDDELQNPTVLRPLLTTKILKTVYDLAQDSGAFDDKQKGGQYQKWGNFAFGIYAKAFGLSEFVAINGTDAYKRLKGKPRDPQDYEDIKKGIAYYDRNIKARM